MAFTQRQWLILGLCWWSTYWSSSPSSWWCWPYSESGLSRLSSPYLSIIIPAYNEEHRLPSTLGEINRFLEKQSFSAECLWSRMAARITTYQIADEFARQHAQFRAIQRISGQRSGDQTRNLEANGQFRFMCDATCPCPWMRSIAFSRRSCGF